MTNRQRRHLKRFWILITLLYNKKLSYCRGTAWHAMLVNSCYVLRTMGIIKVSNGKEHWQWCPSIGHIRFPISLPLRLCLLSCTILEVLSLIFQHFKKSRDFEHIPFGSNISGLPRSIMSPRKPFILGSKGQRSISRGTKNNAGVGFCTLAFSSIVAYCIDRQLLWIPWSGQQVVVMFGCCCCCVSSSSTTGWRLSWVKFVSNIQGQIGSSPLQMRWKRPNIACLTHAIFGSVSTYTSTRCDNVTVYSSASGRQVNKSN